MFNLNIECDAIQQLHLCKVLRYYSSRPRVTISRVLIVLQGRMLKYIVTTQDTCQLYLCRLGDTRVRLLPLLTEVTEVPVETDGFNGKGDGLEGVVLASATQDQLRILRYFKGLLAVQVN